MTRDDLILWGATLLVGVMAYVRRRSGAWPWGGGDGT